MAYSNHKVTIIILNWNGLNDTIECLESVRKIDYPNYEVVVVDNGSTDWSLVTIQKVFPEIHLIMNKKNLGYAEGNNVGIRYALKNGADYVLLLNNDTVVDSQILESFVEAAELYTDAGIFGAKVYFYSEPNRIWSAREKWDEFKATSYSVDRGIIDNGVDFEKIMETDSVMGCSLFVRAELLRKIGLLEDKFFLCYEEVDFSFRARRIGFKSLIVPKAKIRHKISVSFKGAHSPLQEYFSARNELLWAQRNLPISQQWRLYKRIISDLLPNSFKSKQYPLIKRFYWDILNFKENLKNPRFKAKLIGLRDFTLRNFGNCPDYIHQLNSQKG